MQDDRISTDLKIKMLKSKLADLKGSGGGRLMGGGKSSAFKPPRAKKLPLGGGGHGGGGGGKVSVKHAPKPKAPPKPAKFERAGKSSRKTVAAAQKPSPAAARFLPAGGGHRSGPKKRKA